MKNICHVFSNTTLCLSNFLWQNNSLKSSILPVALRSPLARRTVDYLVYLAHGPRACGIRPKIEELFGIVRKEYKRAIGFTFLLDDIAARASPFCSSFLSRYRVGRDGIEILYFLSIMLPFSIFRTHRNTPEHSRIQRISAKIDSRTRINFAFPYN